MSDVAASAIAVAVLTAVHLFAGRIRFAGPGPRSRWLSAAGGVSVAYVFVHLLPELGRRAGIGRSDGALFVYVLALAGLVTYYSVERAVRHRRQRRDAQQPRADAAFALHIGAFAIYNAIIGYIVGRESESPLWFGLAMALHFLVTDYGLQQDHRDAYRRIGRWIVSAAIVGGWAIGMAIQLPERVTESMIALLSGAIILNVMKEELPEERESRLLPFVAAAAGYAAILIAI